MSTDDQSVSPSHRISDRLREGLNALLSRAGQQFDPQRRREIISELFSIWNDPQVSVRRFAVLMSLSVIIGTLGMRDDSEAVVIGAMLIAPLMTPVLAVAAAIVMAWPERLWRSALLIAGASIGAVALAFLIQFIMSPGTAVTVQPDALTARTDPRLVDLGIALAAGAAGAYVQMRREALSALPGVAVAVALVPPLAAIGMFLELGRYSDAFGASLLYLTNLTAMIFAAAVLYLFSGFSPFTALAHSRRRIQLGLGAAFLGVLLVIAPLAFNGYTILSKAREEINAQSAIEEWLGEESPLEIFRLDVSGRTVEIVLAGPEEPPSAEPLAALLVEQLGEPLELRVRWAPVIELAVDVGNE